MLCPFLLLPPLPLLLLLQVKISKVLAQREQAQRKRNLTKYIPNAASAIFTVLEKMAGTDARGAKRRRLQQQQQTETGQELLAMVSKKEVRSRVVGVSGLGYEASVEQGRVQRQTCPVTKLSNFAAPPA
jgi:hypothetical protein